MKTSQRRQLKQDEVTETLQQIYSRLERNRKAAAIIAAIALVGAVSYGGYRYHAGQENAKAGALLAEALVVTEAQVVAPTPPLPGQPPPPPPPAGSYPSEQAKLEAALPKFLAAADSYPRTQAGLAARYHAAAALFQIGRSEEARAQYQKVLGADAAGLYGRMARLALAEIDVREKRYDAAIAALRELSLDAKGDLPVDAVLVQLGRAYLAAGKNTEARQAFERVATEFATSPYAADAKKQLDAIKAGV
jgi:predicted negative regulator of RcsB-dependent stress response